MKRTVETLPGRGYRFVEPLSTASGSILELVPPRVALAPKPQPSRRRLVAWGGMGAALVVFLHAGEIASHAQGLRLPEPDSTAKVHTRVAKW